MQRLHRGILDETEKGNLRRQRFQMRYKYLRSSCDINGGVNMDGRNGFEWKVWFVLKIERILLTPRRNGPLFALILMELVLRKPQALEQKNLFYARRKTIPT